MLFYHQSVEATLKHLDATDQGLTKREAALRLKKFGRNSLKVKNDPLWRIVSEPFRNVFILVLFIAAVVSYFHGGILEGAIILFIIVVSAVIYYVQRFSTDRILRSLKKHSTQRISVLRFGHLVAIDAEELVPGDIVTLSEGDKIPADIRIIESSSARADESVLTGESVPVSKQETVLKKNAPVYEQSNMLFQGSFIVSGTVKGVVIGTGNDTEFGRIAALSKKSFDASSSPVQQKIDRLITMIVAVVAGLSIVAFVIALLRGIELAEAILFVLAIAVSAVPESLPIAISIILVLGMRRMAAKKALVQTMRAIETIGVITTIATDKTGTLTENKLSVQETWQPEKSDHHLPTIAHRTINRHNKHNGDPLDVAMIEFTTAKDLIELPGETVGKLPFDQAFSMSGNIWHHDGAYELVIKGAPEQVMAKSHLSAAEHTEAEVALQSLTGQGYRVIALATATIHSPVENFTDLKNGLRFTFAGFLAVADTLRPTARKAIKVAQNAGVSVRMITGDHFETAYHIGRQLGLVESRDQVFDSRLMSELSETDLTLKVYSASVFSRVTPENKYRILQILKTKEVAAMTGDGVNDVPALASAQVGIAMGSGAQIAKDAGDIILLNNNFESIIRAMHEGRIIYSNIRRMLFYLLSTNTGQVTTLVTAVAIGLPAPLLPVQILWANLVTDTSMVIPLGLEPGEKGIMKAKPVDPKSPLLTKYILSRIAISALAMATLGLSVYAFFGAQFGYDYAQTVTFTALIGMQLANAFSARSTYQSVFGRIRVFSKAFYIGLAASITLQSLALFGPLQGVLGLQPVAIEHLAITVLITFSSMIMVVEIHKWFGRKFIPNQAN